MYIFFSFFRQNKWFSFFLLSLMSSTGLEGLSVEFFLGGDFKFLDAVLGHQGSSATYPSPKDDCTIGHLQKKDGRDLRQLSLKNILYCPGTVSGFSLVGGWGGSPP